MCRYEKNRLIGFVKIGKHTTTRYDVSLQPAGTGSVIRWEQEITSLDKEGLVLLDRITESVYNEKMDHLNSLLEKYLLQAQTMSEHEPDHQ